MLMSLLGVSPPGQRARRVRRRRPPRGQAEAVLLEGPHFLPGERRVVSWVAAEQRPLLPVVSPHLQNGLFEGPRGQGVKDGVEGAVDGQDEYDHPRADGACRGRKGAQRKK